MILSSLPFCSPFFLSFLEVQPNTQNQLSLSGLYIVDKLAETRVRDSWDEHEARNRAKKNSREMYEDHYERHHDAEEYDPKEYAPHERIQEHHHQHHHPNQNHW